MYHRRTQKVRPRSEGVLVAWNRDLFSLFRSEGINFNDQFEELRSRDPVLAMDSLQDNVSQSGSPSASQSVSQSVCPSVRPSLGPSVNYRDLL